MKFTLCKKLRYFRIYKKPPKHLKSRWDKDPGRGGYILFYQETSLMYIHDLVNTIVGEIRHTSREYWSRNRWLGLTSKRLFLHAHLLVPDITKLRRPGSHLPPPSPLPVCSLVWRCISLEERFGKLMNRDSRVVFLWSFGKRPDLCVENQFRHVPFFLSMMILAIMVIRFFILFFPSGSLLSLHITPIHHISMCFLLVSLFCFVFFLEGCLFFYICIIYHRYHHRLRYFIIIYTYWVSVETDVFRWRSCDSNPSH